MPPASHSSAARNARTTRTHHVRARPRRVTQRLPVSKIGWDRKFRMIMLVVFAMVGWLGLKATVALISARTQSAQETSLVSSLERQHRQLVSQERALHQKSTIMRDARQLGMITAGERPYVVVQPGS